MPGGLHPPQSVIESWPHPNYVNPEQRDWTVPVILMVLFFITLLVVCARLWARLIVAQNAGLDDLLIALAMIPLTGLNLAICLGARIYGFNHHTWDQTRESAVQSRQVVLAIELLYILCTCPTKVSILCFYRRMTAGSISKSFIYCVWASIAFVVAYGVAFLLILLLTCRPISAFWHLVDPVWAASHKFTCTDEAVELLVAATISILQDIIACALPVMLVWNLQLPQRQKLAVVGIFGVGLLTCISGIMRIYYVDLVYYRTYDITWACLPGWAWTAVEADLAVVCASAPALKVFFRRYLNISGQRSGYSLGYVQNVSSHLGNASEPYQSPIDPHKFTSTSSPTAGIKISRGVNVKVQSRDEISEYASSEHSSWELMPPQTMHNSPHIPTWPEAPRTMCFAAFGPKETGNIENATGQGRR